MGLVAVIETCYSLGRPCCGDWPSGRARLRDGAVRWYLFQDVEDRERLSVVSLVES